MELINLVKLLLLISGISANYHGPFLVWGPDRLSDNNLPALQSIDERTLTLMYSEAKAIILFVRNGTSKLNKINFPNFSELISKNKWAYFPQENLPAKPVDYNSNVEVITLVGPASQQDIELGALFRDAESIYGKGLVLGILSNQIPEGHFIYKRAAVAAAPADDEDKTENNRENDEERPPPSGEKSEKQDENAEETEEKTANADENELKNNDENRQIEIANQKSEKEETKSKTQTTVTDKKPTKSDYSLFYRESYAILYSSSVPRLTLPMFDIDLNLDEKVPQSETWDRGNLSVKFATVNGTMSIRFNFPMSNGYWFLTSVDVEFTYKNKAERVSMVIVGEIPNAPQYFSYKCAQGVLSFKSENGSLTMSDFQVQAHLATGQNKFSDAYDCVGFMSAAIWSGLLVSSLLIGVTFVGILALLSIRAPNRFESSRSKQLTFTVQE